jgi:molybdenum cofactor cytidylyltransferase
MQTGSSQGLTAVVLAAGAGRRVGHRAKCLLRLDGVSLIRRQLAALADVGVQTVVLVLGHHAAEIAAAVADSPVTTVINPDPDHGPATSLRMGLAAVPDHLGTTLVSLADLALINAQDLRELLHAFDQRPLGTDCLVPSVAGQPGHPLVLDAAARRAWLRLPLYRSGPQWQALGPKRVHHWPTDNGHYRWDIDTPQDIEDLARYTGQICQWPSHESAL